MPNDLLAKYLTGESTPDEKLQAEEWINISDANRQYYEQLKTNNTPDNDAEAWIRLQNLISKNHGGHLDKRGYKFKARWIQLIATILLIGLIGYFIRTRLYRNVTLTVSSGALVVHDDLPDGTQFALNANARLLYPARFTGNKRVVNLTGEAFFDIQTDKLPFIINIQNLSVTATSALINIKGSDKQIEITVINGSAKVSSNGKELLISPGEKVTCGINNSTFIKEVNVAKRPPAWAIKH